MRRRLVVVLAALALATGCATGEGGDAGAPRPGSPAPAAQTSAPDHNGLGGFRSSRSVDTVAAPVRLRIPSIGVSSRLERLGRRPDGAVAVPRDWQSAGWYAEGPRPGERGSAVILGHVDSPAGPAVFARLSTLRQGDPVLVERADGSRVRFAVTRVERHRRRDFPTRDVYYPTLAQELRLITCAGDYVPEADGYQDNVIVFAGRPQGRP